VDIGRNYSRRRIVLSCLAFICFLKNYDVYLNYVVTLNFVVLFFTSLIIVILVLCITFLKGFELRSRANSPNASARWACSRPKRSRREDNAPFVSVARCKWTKTATIWSPDASSRSRCPKYHVRGRWVLSSFLSTPMAYLVFIEWSKTIQIYKKLKPHSKVRA
jgi:hypothetical protein